MSNVERILFIALSLTSDGVTENPARESNLPIVTQKAETESELGPRPPVAPFCLSFEIHLYIHVLGQNSTSLLN